MTGLSLLFCLTLMTVPETAPETDTTAIELDPIIVVGQREGGRLSRIVNSGFSVTPEEVRESQQPNVISKLAAGHAAVSISSARAAGFGLGTAGHGKLLIRGLGFSPNRGTLVLIDGRPDIAGLFGHPLPDTYRRAGTRSIDLVKGGSSMLYGSNAIAGVLNIESFYRPDLDHYSNIELTTGSFHTHNAVVQHSRKIGDAVVAGWYEYIESDNERASSDYANRSGGFRAQLTRGTDWSMFLSGKYSSFNFADPGPTFAPSLSSGDIERLGTTLGADLDRDRVAASLRTYVSYGEHAFSDGFSSIDRNLGIDLFGRYRLAQGADRFSISGGLSANRLSGSAQDGTAFILGGDKANNELAAHLQLETTLRDRYTLIAGGRYVDHDQYGGHFVYQVGAVARWARYGSFKASVATAYRNPTINEAQLFRISSPGQLEPEEGTFYEVGYFNRLNDRLSIEGTVFWREGDNLIATASAPGQAPPVRFQNVGSYSHSGWEATLRFVDGPWVVRPSFMHLNQDDYNLSVPEDKLVIAGEYDQRPLAVEFQAVAAFSTRSDSLGTPVVLDDYLTINLGHRYFLNEHLILNLHIDNLFDAEYETVAGYPMPGITFRTGLALRWQ